MSVFELSLTLLAAVMHSAWNLLVHVRRQDALLLVRLPLVFGLVGVLPIAMVEYLNPQMTSLAWRMLVVAVICQTLYYLGLTMAYRAGDFSIVYPIARAVPIVMLAMVDQWRGRDPTWLGWLGVMLVTIGCLLLGVQAMRTTNGGVKPTLWIWIGVTSLATFGYSVVDKVALESMRTGLDTALRYGVFELLFGALGASVCLGGCRWPCGKIKFPKSWAIVLCGAFLLGVGYVLILWVYQQAGQVSYVVAVRQVSVFIGVCVAAMLYERVGVVRIILALIIAIGVAIVAIA